MIAIDRALISEDVVEAQFVCDLHRCKGGCCEDGDAGAPLEDAELQELEKAYAAVSPYLTHEGRAAVATQGYYVHDEEFGWVTPTIRGAMCAYGLRDENGIIKCGIEAAYNDGKIGWKKPISCHLFPIRIQETKHGTLVNYEPREILCKAACTLGKKVKLPVYQFLKEAIVRKFGSAFYEALHETALHLQHKREEKKARKA